MHGVSETIEHAGLTVDIIQDTDDRGPDEWGNTDLFLVAFHRDFTVERDGFSEGLVQSIFNGGKYEDGSINHEARDVMKKYHVFGLEAYIHSGVALALSREGNFPDRQWDVSQLGAVFAEKESWRLNKSARKAALGLIKTWNQSLSGDVWGYVVRGPEGEDLGSISDSCWGHYGYDYAVEQGKEAAEYCAKELQEKRAKKLKSYIKNKVPYAKRDLSI